MELKIQALLDRCIDDGLTATVYGTDIELTTAQMQRIIDKAKHEIWLQLDAYFTFDDTNN